MVLPPSSPTRWVGTTPRSSDKPCFRPPLFKGCMKERGRGFALELPLPLHPHVLLMIDACPPHGPVPVAKRTWHKEVPLGSRRVTLHVNLPIQTIVDGKREELRGTPEERPDGVSAFKPSQALAFPHRVLGKERRKTLRVVLVIAIRRIPRL